MTATKKSTLKELSATGELLRDGFLTAAKNHAAIQLQDGKQGSVDAATQFLVKTSTVLIERYNLPRDLRDSLLAATAEVLKIAHSLEAQKMLEEKAD